MAMVFDGVYMNSDVYLNGKLLGNHPYGYTPFQYDVTDDLKFDGPNTVGGALRRRATLLAMVLRCRDFRPVQLVITDPVHIAPWGTYLTPKKRVTRNLRSPCKQRSEMIPMKPSKVQGHHETVRDGVRRRSGASDLKVRCRARMSPKAPRTSNRFPHMAKRRSPPHAKFRTELVVGRVATSVSRGHERYKRAKMLIRYPIRSASARSSSPRTMASSSTASGCRSREPATTTIWAHWARRSIAGPWSGNCKFLKRWATTPCARRTIRRRRSSWNWPTKWDSS